jgi:hypothetical protein
VLVISDLQLVRMSAVGPEAAVRCAAAIRQQFGRDAMSTAGRRSRCYLLKTADLAEVGWLNDTFKQLLHKILWRVRMNKDEKKTTIAWTTPTLVEICIGRDCPGCC